ncbi:8255_t:CDS:2, partial [Gigaspora margarita]
HTLEERNKAHENNGCEYHINFQSWKSDNQLVSLDNKYIWTATSDSSIKQWLDVPPRHIRKAISQTSSPSMSPTSPQLSQCHHLQYLSYGVTLNAEVATLYSVTTDDQKLESLDIEDQIPLRDSPDFAIKGQHGLIKCTILINRRHIITLDNSGEVAFVFDLKRSASVTSMKLFRKLILSNIYQLGALTVHLDERTCFDAEAYEDELDLQESADIREDQR